MCVQKVISKTTFLKMLKNKWVTVIETKMEERFAEFTGTTKTNVTCDAIQKYC